MATAILETCLTPNMDASNMDIIQCETRLGEDKISPGFAKYLEQYYKKANARDKAKCLELLTSLNIQKEIKGQLKKERPSTSRNFHRSTSAADYHTATDRHFLRRPRTTMAFTGQPQSDNSVYLTTYKREFPQRRVPSVVADRPKSTNAFTASHELQGPIGSTTYNGQFYSKPARKQSPIRTGTASGQRRNNPHPNQTFMVWRFPRDKGAGGPSSETGEDELTDEVMDQVCRGKCRTTYQTDYLGVPQGVQMEEVMNLPQDWKSKVPYTLDTSTRNSYKAPEKIEPLQGNVTRYGCNMHKNKSAVGTVPTCSSRFFHVNARTSYEREFSDPVAPNATDLRELSKSLNQEMIQKNMIGATAKEQETLENVLREMNSSRPATQKTGRRFAPAATPTTREFNPSWHSSWTGPM